MSSSSASGSAGPRERGWIVSIHATASDYEPLGTGVVIDERRVLTCAHVAASRPGASGSGASRPGASRPGASGSGAPELWVAFPMADNPDERRKVIDRRVDDRLVADVAVLELDTPVPGDVGPARVKCPKPEALRGLRWWALGFTRGDPFGNSADGIVGEHLGHGRVRLDVESRYVVEAGLSGGGVWSPDYDAVVALVGQGNDRGDGQAITFHRLDQCLPREELRALAEAWDVAAAGEVAAAAWGWSLESDPEGRWHWRPRARGVSVESERGYRFRGRRRALTEITAWLDRSTRDRKVLVVTGSPGVGKSAVLGRVVTTADPSIVAALPLEDDAVRASVGSVACAVHAKGKSALEVAGEIAKAASAPLPARVEDLPAGLRDALRERTSRQRFNVVIDALDEAATPQQARVMVTKVIRPLAETCADLGAQVVVGTRRHDDAGDLLGVFGAARTTIDLDQGDYFAAEDLTAYALATLQLAGDERAGNPYADLRVAGPVAARIAELAGRNFLVAGLVARGHGLHDQEAVPPEKIVFVADVETALHDYLDHIPPAHGTSADRVLAGLALAEAPGLTVDLWRLAVAALTGHNLTTPALKAFAAGSAANFLIETGRHDGRPAYRLYHQALNDALLRRRAQAGHRRQDDERALAHAFLTDARERGWEQAPPYVLRSLAGHAARGGLLDDLLQDEDYLLRADLRRLAEPADDAATSEGQARARLLHLTPQALDTGPAERRALFTITEALENLGTSFRGHTALLTPYQAVWASAIPRTERATLTGHTSGVSGVCAVRAGGRDLLASASIDRTMRLWDPVTGTAVLVVPVHHPANAVTAVGDQLAVGLSAGVLVLRLGSL